MQTCLREGFVELDHRLVWPDGQVRWINQRAWINFDAEGHPARLNITAQDITGRRQIEKMLGIIENKERALLAAVPDMIVHFNAAGTIIDFRGTTPERRMPIDSILGKNARDLLGLHLLPAPIIEQVSIAIDKVRTDRQLVSVEFTTPGQHHYETRFVPLGQTDEVIALVRDITERKQAETDLRTSEEKYRSLLESSDAAISMIDRDGRYLYLNTIAALPYGTPAEALIGQTVYDLFSPDQANQILQDVRIVIASNTGLTLEPEVTIGGKSCWFSTRMQPIRDATGQPYAALIHASEITKRKLMEFALQASETRYRSIVEDQTDLICRYDTQMHVTFGNAAYCKSFGVAPEEIVGKSFFARIPAEEHEQAREYIRSLTHAQPSAVSVHHSIQADGSMCWVEWKDRAIFDEQGEIIEYQGVGRDITEQKLTQMALVASEQKLRQSEAYLRSLIDSQAAFNVRIDLMGSITYCNDRYTREFGWVAPSLVGLSPLLMVIPDDHEKVLQAARECLANVGKPVQVEIRKPTQDGGHIWTLWEFITVQDSSGEVTEIHCVGFDITKQKQAEAALQESYELLEQRVIERTAELQRTTDRLGAIFDHSADAILLVDIDQGIQQANHAFGNLIGWQPDAYLGQRLASFFQPEDVESIEQVMQATAGSKQTHHIELRILRVDKTTRDVEISLAPVTPSAQAVTNLVCIIRDMTAHKMAEAEMLAQSQRLTLAAEAGGMGVWEWDIQHDQLTWDERMYALYGIAPQDAPKMLHSLWLSSFLHPDDIERLQRETEIYLNKGSVFNSHFKIFLPDRTVRHIRVKAVLLRDSDQRPIRSIGINWDVTDEKAAAEALERALQQEQELGELKSRFVSMASHEFRTPLASILATTDTLSLYRDRMDEPKIDERLNRIRQQVMHMTDIIEDMLQLARIQAGRVRFEPAIGNVGALCSEILEEFESQADYRGRIIYEADPQPVIANFDSRLLRQIISNLVHNALKYSVTGQSILLTLQQSECHFCFTIKDDGIGVPPEDLKRLFEPFHRASNVGAISGTGLGLSIAHQAVELHGGTITVESVVGTGTVFTVVLPKAQTDAHPNCASET